MKYIKHRTPYLSSSINKNIILQGNNFFGGNIYRRLYKSVALNEFALQEPHESNDYFSHNYPMNPELKKELFNDLPHLDKNDLAIYLYLKLCYILRYDEHFDAAGQYGKIALVHEDPNRLTQITPEKCDIVCYEFVYLYAQILNELGIDYLINSKKPDEYGKRHISLSLKFDEKTVVLVTQQKQFSKMTYILSRSMLRFMVSNASTATITLKNNSMSKLTKFMKYTNCLILANIALKTIKNIG